MRSGPLRSTSRYVCIVISGVRSSWLTLAMNSSLSASSCFARSYATPTSFTVRRKRRQIVIISIAKSHWCVSATGTISGRSR